MRKNNLLLGMVFSVSLLVGVKKINNDLLAAKTIAVMADRFGWSNTTTLVAGAIGTYGGAVVGGVLGTYFGGPTVGLWAGRIGAAAGAL
jgi:hypothetical protein